MKTGNKKVIIGGFLTLLMILMVSAIAVFSQERQGRGDFGGRKMHGRGHDGFGRFMRDLNLSDAQKQQLEQIAARHKESTKSLHEQMRNLHRGSDAKAFDGSFNEAAVRQAAQARANLQVELEVARARMMSEMYSVLTPEQKAQLAQQREERKQRRQQRMNEKRGNDSSIQQQ
jgi:Spy/CpxP family protein refolding chaperone